MKTAFIYSDEFWRYDYGVGHPMRPLRLKLTYDLMKSYGLFDPDKTQLIEARKASTDELLLFHTPDYIQALVASNNGITPKDGPQYGLGLGDNPVFKGVYDWSLYSTGASVQAVELILENKADIAFNICGGLHHAMADRASGFCYLNDAAVAIAHLMRSGKRVLYVDIDAHHGDGVQAAFYDTDKVMTISIHEGGEYLFPGTGFPQEVGNGAGKGYSINVPLSPESDDEVFLCAFEAVVPRCVERFMPDVLVTQLGVDTFKSDPITHLNLTTNGFETMLRWFKSADLPWVALGGGGYNLSNVARGWTLAWSIMNEKKILDEIPDEYLVSVSGLGFFESYIRDKEYVVRGSKKQDMLKELVTTTKRLQEACHS